MQTRVPRVLTASWLVWIVGVPGIGLLGALLGVPQSGDFVSGWVFPWMFVAASAAMALSFHARRHRGWLTKTSRGDYRFAGSLVAGGTLTGHNNYGLLTIAIGAVCLLAIYVPTPVPHVPLGQQPVEGEPDA